MKSHACTASRVVCIWPLSANKRKQPTTFMQYGEWTTKHHRLARVSAYFAVRVFAKNLLVARVVVWRKDTRQALKLARCSNAQHESKSARYGVSLWQKIQRIHWSESNDSSVDVSSMDVSSTDAVDNAESKATDKFFDQPISYSPPEGIAEPNWGRPSTADQVES